LDDFHCEGSRGDAGRCWADWSYRIALFNCLFSKAEKNEKDESHSQLEK
jgi:hypothetical protein